ncbi:THUMP domain-containing protein [Ramlibacter sp.]|uniref:THUMP domain-containing class I SAM-dependent RNA methyltransferase n=1 Tax=Ramlibacter sp. TaxID=1917967 RepID=UPI002607B966|nr:THUMP domain-containing protein [Ramlibacter sp.]MDB5957184.1 N6-adenine-specific methylase-like protein [Ramlibacter sp.]
MRDLPLFLPCAGGVEAFLADEVARIAGAGVRDLRTARGGVQLQATWPEVMKLNLHSRLAQRVLVQLSHTPYRAEQDLYEAASAVPWEEWFTTRDSFKIELTAHQSPLKSLNFAALRIKDAVADRFRTRGGTRPDVDTQRPVARIFGHLAADTLTLYIDTSGEPLFKRGWREDKGEAPLKETLAAAMIAASGWDGTQPLYDPCCGSGTILIEAAQVACNIAPGSLRRFGFERLRPHAAADWQAIKAEAQAARRPPAAPIFGSDVAFRMVDFAQRNAQRAGVEHAVQLRGGDALQRMPPIDVPGVMLLNPPYGERIEAGGIAGPGRGGRERAQMEQDGDFFTQLAAHWKRHYAGWTAWVLSPDAKLPTRMRLKESRRVPMWNGPIECRLLRFDMVAGSARTARPQDESGPAGGDAAGS